MPKIEMLENISIANPVKAIMELDKMQDIRDEKWGHPVLRDADPARPWDMSEMGASGKMYDPSVSNEEKIAIGNAMMAAVTGGNGGSQEVEHTCDIQVYRVPGCPEEPEAEVEVRVYRPKGLKKKKARCMYYCLGGALTIALPEMFPIEELCCRYKCVAIVPIHRRSYIAQYPAAINDVHAGYQWMMENVEKLQIHPDNIILMGQSSGAHLALALGFRLKRYGYNPKGIIAVAPQTDERETDNLSIYNGSWDSVSQHDALSQWLGNNFGSSRVGPEALANHAKVEDCIGYPPCFIHTSEFDPDRHYNRDFYGKLLEAQTYAEYHCWGGAHHSSPQWSGATVSGELNKYSERVKVVIDANVEDCFEYDLRRPWVVK